ncbi:MAG: hypothetical protein RQ833_07500 [Sphingomonadaceae bacterium]|nr:hypothetical protein [Sphingomonadaceae bacterium]
MRTSADRPAACLQLRCNACGNLIQGHYVALRGGIVRHLNCHLALNGPHAHARPEAQEWR